MNNVTEMPDLVTMRSFTEVDDGKWGTTEYVLNDPVMRRRLTRTQIEEMLTLYGHYPLPEFDAVGQILRQMQRAYGDVEPFNHPMLAALEPEDEDVA